VLSSPSAISCSISGFPELTKALSIYLVTLKHVEQTCLIVIETKVLNLLMVCSSGPEHHPGNGGEYDSSGYS